MKTALIAVPVLLSGCMLAAKELQVETRPLSPAVPFFSQQPQNVYQGVGGTRKMLVGSPGRHGTSLWTHGSPPCTFEVLDVVHDKRGAGQLSMASLEMDMVQEASARNATDIILLEQHLQAEERPSLYNVGYGNAHGPTTVMAPIQVSNTSYAVTRCIDQVPQQVQDEWRR